MWLRALDPLEPGKAGLVRSQWSQDESQATVFPSKAYGDQVAARNPGNWHYVFIDAEPTT
jgi:hypothetical protein